MRTNRKKCFKMGITIDKWGPGAWNTLHSFAHKASESLDTDEREEWRLFLYLFSKRLPCPKCRTHFKQYLDANVTTDTFATREGLVRFLHDAHNDVNTRLGKPTWTYEDHRRLYARPASEKQSTTTTLLLLLILCVVAVCARKKC